MVCQAELEGGMTSWCMVHWLLYRTRVLHPGCSRDGERLTLVECDELMIMADRTKIYSELKCTHLTSTSTFWHMVT